MIEEGKIKKTLKPSERDSITVFASSFGEGGEYDKREKRRSILRIVGIVLGVIALVTLGFVITDTFIDITELPLN